MKDKGTKYYHMIDVATQNGTNIANDVIKNITDYFDLKAKIAKLFEIQRWYIKMIRINLTLVIVAFGSIL